MLRAAATPEGPRPADRALRQVVDCYLRSHAKPGVTWTPLASEPGLRVRAADGRAFLLPLSCAQRELGLDAALRRLNEWQLLDRWG